MNIHFSRFTSLWFASLSFVLIFSACNKDKKARPLPPNLGEYVAAFTTGTISKNDPVKIQFASPVISDEMVGSEDKTGIISISPGIRGKSVWESSQTLAFQPAEPFRSGQVYVTTVRLEKIIKNLPEELASFDFDFRTRDLFASLYFESIETPDPDNFSTQEIRGIVQTSDAVEPEEVEKAMAAEQAGNKLKVTWEHDGGLTTHRFLATAIKRGNTDSKVSIRLTGSNLGLKNEKKLEIEIPALGNFKVTEARVVQESEQYVLINFSDPLSQDQNLEGLVRVPGFEGFLRFVIDGSTVRAYPSSRLAGSYQVLVEPGVQNIKGAKMPNQAQWALEFAQNKPAVRLVGRGVIMPNSSGLTFPFEAIELTAVEVEVFKIYNNNILQFLQNNELDGSWQLEQVGRVILQKKIPLEKLNPGASAADWSRYGLDLSQLIQQDPSSIYQIRIGFRPEYSEYACDGNNSKKPGDANLVEVRERTDENGEIISFWDSWYGIDGWYEGYTWEHRDNPCFPAYYNNDVFINRNVIASNLGLVAKSGKEGETFIAVAHLKSTEPVSGADVEFYDFQQQLIARAKTDGEGMVKTKLSKKPFAVIASKGADKGYLKLGDGSSLSLSKFDVSGSEAQRGLKGFLYGERGVWRPGDTLFLNFVMEDESGKLPKDHPVSFELYDSRGQVQKKLVTTQNVNGIYPLTTVTSSAAPTGNWLAKVKVGGAVFDKILKIETVKPNRLKINLDLGKKVLTAKDDPLNVALQVNWLHGAPAKNLKAVVEIQLNASDTRFEKYPDYEFDDPSKKINAEPKVAFDGNLDANGFAKINYDLLQSKNVPGKLLVKFKTRAFEKSGDFSTDNFSVFMSPFDTYAGVSLPKNQWGQERFDKDKQEILNLISLDANGKPIAGKTLEAAIYRVDWNWWWDEDDGNTGRFNSAQNIRSATNTTVKTGSDGRAQWAVTLDDYGRFFVRVCDPESGHCSAKDFYVGYNWFENDNAKSEATMLTFTSDKPKYKLGETVELTVPSGNVGRVLLTLENGSKVVESHWKDAKDGDNKIKFTATKEMVPTIYAHVALVQPHGQTTNDLPIRLYGVIPVEVEDPATKLQPQLKMPETLAPEQEVNIEVSEKSGQPMAYTIAMVDDGLLDLTRFKTPDPWNVFYAREALGVRTWDVYDFVLGSYGGELERILSVGGDAELQPAAANKNANRFKPVVKNLGPFYLKKGQKATHKIRMPNYVGSVRTMLVAANEGAYGSAEKTTPVKKPLMILATLPRVLGPGENFKLPVDVFAMENKVKNVSINVKESSGLVQFVSGKTQDLAFSKPDNKMAYFDLQAGNKTGIAKFLITASGNGEQASQEIEIEIRNPNPYISKLESEILEPGQVWQPVALPFGMEGTNKALLELSSIPPIDLGRRLDYLLTYPYGCLEQTLSSGFPQLYVSNLLKLDDSKQKKVAANVQATVDKLRNFQNEQGGFNYWPGNNGNYFNAWSNSYAGHFLIEAKALGYGVPQNMIDRWVSAQEKMAKLWNPVQQQVGLYSAENDQLSQAYRLYTLAIAGKPSMGAMNRLREMKNLSLDAKWRLAAAYAVAGKPEVATNLTKNLSMNARDYRELSNTFGSATRDRALILETLVLLGEKKAAGEMVRTLAQELSRQSWLSTQDIAFSLLAIGKFVGNQPQSESFAFDYQVSKGKLVNAGSAKPVFQTEFSLNGTSSGQEVYIKNTGKVTLFARLVTTGQPVAGAENSEASKIQIAVNYKSMDGKPVDPARMAQGTDFVAEVTVTNPGLLTGSLKELALSQIFPSGWEVINTRLDGMERFNNSSRPKYADIRDDRVYTFFDLNSGTSQTYHVLLNAAYQGRFYLPAVVCEAMYDNSVYARQAGKWVEVTTSTEL